MYLTWGFAFACSIRAEYAVLRTVKEAPHIKSPFWCTEDTGMVFVHFLIVEYEGGMAQKRHGLLVPRREGTRPGQWPRNAWAFFPSCYDALSLSSFPSQRIANSNYRGTDDLHNGRMGREPGIGVDRVASQGKERKGEEDDRSVKRT